MAPLIRDRYEPGERVVGTGRSEVWRARDTYTDLPVALKSWTLPEGADRQEILGEMRALLTARPHPRLPQVRDGFFEEDRFYLVMDWVEGESLERAVARAGPMLPSAVLDRLAETAEALDHLHGQNPPLVHGDVRPANLIAGDAGLALVGYGVASLDSGEERGPWRAPEGGAATASGDVWSLAATAFTLLTGASPERAAVDWEGAALSASVPFERSVRRALSLVADARPDTAGELVERLRSWAEQDLPSGTVTFLMTDVEGSTRMWDADPKAMATAVARHDEIFAAIAEEHTGRLIKTRGEGDAVFCVFSAATDAARAALAAQRAVLAEPWPEGIAMRVRVGVHTGEAELRQGDYFGPTVNRCARIKAIGHGGQILMSEATADLVTDALPSGARLDDRGQHRLKDLSRAERVYQLWAEGLPEEFPPLRSMEAMPNNLPMQVTSFVPRDAEEAEIRKLLEEARLLTLTGPGGSGKTRLALQVAADVLDRFPDGVWLVELAPLADPDLVAGHIAATIGVREDPARPILDTLVEHCSTRTMLMILDNCEHLIGAVASLTDDLLRAGKDVRIVATSRELLGVTGEMRYPVPPLPAPDPERVRTPEALLAFESVRLFRDRAAQVKTGFDVTAVNARAVAEICARLDGIPFAIELAAARVKVITPEQIASKLGDMFRLLTGASRTALPHQQTLRATMDWSYEPLSEPERTLFRRLAVFAGGFDLEAVEGVCTDDILDVIDVLDLVAQLADRSLLGTQEVGDAVRYRMLETVREYAREKLAASGEAEPLRERHLDRYGEFAKQARGFYGGPEASAWLDRLDLDLGNLRAALEWGLEPQPRVEGMRMACDLGEFWLQTGRLTEGRRWIERGLGAEAEQQQRAEALNAAGSLAFLQGDYDHARARWEESLAIRREIDDRRGVAQTLVNLGTFEAGLGRGDEAKSLLEEALVMVKEVGDQRLSAIALTALGSVAFSAADYAAARAMAEETLSLARASGDDEGVAVSLSNLADIARVEGDLSRARSLLEESLEIQRRAAEAYVPETLTKLGNIALEEGRLDDARASLTEALEGARQLGDAVREAEALVMFGEVAVADGKPDEGIAFAQQSLLIGERVGVSAIEMNSRRVLGSAAVAVGRWEDARAHLERARALAGELEMPAEAAEIEALLGSLGAG